MGGGAKSFHSLNERGGEARKVLPWLREGGGAQKVSDPRFSHFVAPPLPVINEQSLMEPGTRSYKYLECFTLQTQ